MEEIDKIKSFKIKILDNEKYLNNFNKLKIVFKNLLGLLVINDSKVEKKQILTFFDNQNKESKINIYFKVKASSKNNFIIDFNFEIVQNNQLKEFTNLSELLIYTISMKLFPQIVTSIITSILTVNTISIDIRNISTYILAQAISLFGLIELLIRDIKMIMNNNQISLANRFEICEYNNFNNLKIIEERDITVSQIFNFKNLFDLSHRIDAYQNEKTTPLNIFEISEFLYFSFMETDFSYDESMMNLYLSSDFNLYNEKIKHPYMFLFNHFDFPYRFNITPLIKYSNIKMNNEEYEGFVDFWREKDFFEILLNGKYFIQFNENNEIPNEYRFINKSFNENQNDMDVVIKASEKYFYDSKLWDNFGEYINQFSIGELTIEKNLEMAKVVKDSEMLNLRLRVASNNFDDESFDENFAGKFPMIDKVFSIIVSDLNHKATIACIETLKVYLESIYFTYPLHATIIGLNDQLYYLNLYNYFPLFRKYQLPIISNGVDLIAFLSQNITNFKSILNTEMLANSYHKFNDKEIEILFNLFMIDNSALINEAFIINDYIEKTSKLLRVFGMNFGSIDLILLANNKKNFIDRMPKQSLKNFKYAIYEPEIQKLSYKDLIKIIDYLITKNYYYDINYFIENFIKIMSEPISETIQNLFYHFRNLIQYKGTIGYRNNISQYFLLYPTKMSVYRTIFHAGINILFLELSKEQNLIIKLNKTSFNDQEKRIIIKLFPDCVLLQPQNSLGIIIKGISIETIFENFGTSYNESNEAVYDFITELKESYYDIFKEEHEYYMKQVDLMDESKRIYDKPFKTPKIKPKIYDRKI